MIFDNLIKNGGDVLDLIFGFNDNKNNLLVTYFNQHCFNIYKANTDYKKIVEDDFRTYLDGFGIYLALKIFSYKNVEKFNASDLNEAIVRFLIREKKRVFIIGGSFQKNK